MLCIATLPYIRHHSVAISDCNLTTKANLDAMNTITTAHTQECTATQTQYKRYEYSKL